MTKWMTAEVYKKLLGALTELDVATTFELNSESDLDQIFFVEVACLNYWNKDAQGAPDQEGINFKKEVWTHVKEGFYLDITCNDNHTQPLTFFYKFNRSARYKWGLEIIYKGILLYARNANQNPVTEWEYNELAVKAMDENGKPIFHGPRDPDQPNLPYGG